MTMRAVDFSTASKTAMTALVCLVLALPASADTGSRSSTAAQADRIVAALPAFKLTLPASDTHPALKITPMKPWLLRLDGTPASISIDDNSAGLRVVRYGEKSIVLLSKGTGAAHITVKDSGGGVLMSRGVLIPEAKQKYVRVDSRCTGHAACAPRIFYCPNLCYETTLARAGLE